VAAAGDSAAVLAQGLAQTFGSIASFDVCRVTPPALVAAPEAARGPGDTAEVLAAVADFSAGQDVTSRPASRGGRVTVLPLPGGPPDLVLVITVEAGPIARAARLLTALADPAGTGADAATEHLGDAVNRLLDAAESQSGVRASAMSRSQKQDLVKYLDERGAFLIKKSVEQVAVRLGVSRFTIYNYLDQANRDDEADPARRSEQSDDQ
jgi:hypothetical protein